MLMITRKPGEWIQVGDEIWIKVVRFGPEVLLGIEAPKDLPILRGEPGLPGELPAEYLRRMGARQQMPAAGAPQAALPRKRHAA